MKKQINNFLSKSVSVKSFLFFMAIFFSFTTTQNAGKVIIWSETNHLTWEDFQGKPNNGDRSANSNVAINCKSSLMGNSLTIIIKSEFNRKKSWVKKSSNKGQNLLQHEQGHFDLTEIYSRHLRKKIRETKFKKKSALNDIDKMYEEISKLNDKAHNLYDLETDHSLIEEKQNEWERKIKNQLQELEEFTDTLIIIQLK